MGFNLGRIVKQTSIAALLIGAGLASTGCNNNTASIVAQPGDMSLQVSGVAQTATVSSVVAGNTTLTQIKTGLVVTSNNAAVATASIDATSGVITVAPVTAGTTSVTWMPVGAWEFLMKKVRKDLTQRSKRMPALCWSR